MKPIFLALMALVSLHILFFSKITIFSLIQGMFDPPAKHEEKSWAENMAIVVGISYVSGEMKALFINSFCVFFGNVNYQQDTPMFLLTVPLQHKMTANDIFSLTTESKESNVVKQ